MEFHKKINKFCGKKKINFDRSNIHKSLFFVYVSTTEFFAGEFKRTHF